MTAVERAEATVSDGPLRATLTARLLDVEVAAGGPCRVELTVTAEGGTLFLAVGTDRRTRRPAYVRVSGTVAGVQLDDPAGAGAGAGVGVGVGVGDGPAGAVPVEPGSPHRQVVLVNQFVALERARELVIPGASQELRVVLSRPLPLATTVPQALAGLASTPLDVEVVAELTRDDDALARSVEDAAAVVRGRWTAATSNELEAAVATLLALRVPESRAALSALRDHPNALVREAAAAT